MDRKLVGALAGLVVLVVGAVGWMMQHLQASPDPVVDTALYGVHGDVLTTAPPVVGFAPAPLPDTFDVDGLGQHAPLQPLPQPVAATGEIAAQAYGSTYVLGTHAGVAMHLFRLDTGGWWDRMVGRTTVQDGICFDAGAYGFCTNVDQLERIDTTPVWGPSAQDPGPGQRIAIWAPVPDGTAVVGLEVAGEPVAWQVPSGPAAVIAFDRPGEAEMTAYDTDGQVVGAFTDSRQ